MSLFSRQSGQLILETLKKECRAYNVQIIAVVVPTPEYPDGAIHTRTSVVIGCDLEDAVNCMVGDLPAEFIGWIGYVDVSAEVIPNLVLGI